MSDAPEVTDFRLAQLYVSKACRARDTGLEFSLTLAQFKRLMKRKTCAYTGVELTTKQEGRSILETDRTFERINPERGYTPGNTTVVCHAANNIKSIWENPNSLLTPELVSRIIRRSTKS